jgi:hypothetical protein
MRFEDRRQRLRRRFRTGLERPLQLRGDVSLDIGRALLGTRSVSDVAPDRPYLDRLMRAERRIPNDGDERVLGRDGAGARQSTEYPPAT